MNCVERWPYGNPACSPNNRRSSQIHHSRSNEPIIVKAGNIAAAKIYRSKCRKRLKSGRHRSYDMFRVAYYAVGKRKLETFANLKDAKERAGAVARAVVNGRLAVLELKHTDREQYLSAIQQLKPLGIPLHSAIEEYVAARSHLDGESLLSAVKEHVTRRQKVIDKPVRQIVEEMIAAKERDRLSQRYVETLRYHLNRFAAAFQTNIGSVTARMIDDWLAGLKTLSPRSRNDFRQDIVTLFRHARARGYLPKGQPTEAEEVPKAKDRGGEIGVLTPTQLAELFETADEEARLYLAIGAFTGLRSAEMLRLEWQDVNFARAHIEVGKHKAKTATRRLVPIQPNLIQWLAPYREAMRGSVFSSEHAAIRVIARAKQILGKWPSNALRHSYATYRLAQCNDAARVALEMGNSPQMLFRNYRELSDERDALAWFSIVPKHAANVVQMKQAARDRR